jgi:thioredoxin 1
MAKETTDLSFKKDVLDADVPVLVDFWAPWCGPCRIAGPIIDRIGEKVNGKALVYKLNVDDNPQAARDYGVSGIPTVIIFKAGKVVQTMVGLQQEKVYMNALGI